MQKLQLIAKKYLFIGQMTTKKHLYQCKEHEFLQIE